ncbi:MAG: hypothetical protein ACR2P8_02100, partial [Myxococcota bacterium]
IAPPRAVVVRVAGDPEAVPARIAVVSRREAAPAEPLGLTVSTGRLVRADPSPPPTLPDGFRVTERDGQHWVTASPGDHALREDLRVPPGFGLALLPGTHLRMGAGVVIVVEGPVEIVGTATRPVEISAQDEAWEGLVVLGADRRSRIEHARLRGVAPRPGSVGPRRDGWMQTGGVVFVDAPVSIAHVHFEDFATEDALNVLRADVDLRDVVFRRMVSDAFDGDFVRGEIEGAKLEDIGGDGIDLSGSEVVIRDVRARAVRDKAVSVGERSRVSVAGLDSEDGAFALVAKDGSVVDVRDVRTRDIWVALAAFTKKNEFGPAVLTASDLVVSGRSFPSLVQTGSRLTLDGRHVATRSFDSGDLYAPR